jgi:hypothetical protein
MAALAQSLLRTADTFEWRVGVTPLSDRRWAVAAPCAYVAAVLALRTVLGGRTVPLGPLPALHNLVLLVWSAAMFVGAAHAAFGVSSASGDASWLFCFPPEQTAVGRLFFCSYCYYVSKYYELLDTVLRVLKGQPLTVLHVVHHALVLVMAYSWLDSAQSLQVVGLLTNTGIHVLMYGYYLLSSLGLKPGRLVKQLITSSQIVQFLFSLVCSVPFLAMHLVTRPEGCAGFRAWAFNCSFNVLLLYLFRDFHRRTYDTGAAAKKAKTK